jgi:predicted NAD/FAD-binding protein
MAAAIWSTPSMRILDYPAASLFRFYANHGLLQVSNMPRWSTVVGGSRVYVEKISEPFRQNARLGCGVVSVARTPSGVVVNDETGASDRFDAVVIAAHADRALAMLKAPTPRERSVLGAFKYQSNQAVVHVDPALMPTRKRAWASWNYLGGDGAASVTYWMNLLQQLDCERNIFVTLNPLREVRKDCVIATFDYDHPMFDVATGAAQKELWSLQGEGGVWYCGAHFGAGFHEDGVQSGLAVAEDLGGVKRPWTVANESGRIWRGAPALPLPVAAE